MSGRVLTNSQQKRLMAPITTAIIAMRLRRCSHDHAHDVFAQLLIAHRIAQLVPRHRHLLPELVAATDALQSMLERYSQRTVKDAYVNGTDIEIDALDLAAQIYAALLKTTPLKTVRRAMLNVSEKVKNADAVHR